MFINAKTNSKNLFYYQPETFDPKNYPGPIARFPNSALGLLHTLYERRVMHNIEPLDFQNLKFDYLRRVMGSPKTLLQVRKHMEECNLIECIHSYVIGVKSFQYRIGPVLQDCNWIRSTVPKRAERGMMKSHDVDKTDWQPVHHWLYDNLQKVSIAPSGYLDPICDSQLRQFRLQAVQDHNYFFSPDLRYGRVFTNITSLNRELRPYITFNNIFLSELDISNSQPFFSIQVLLNLFFQTNILSSKSELKNLLLSSLTWSNIKTLNNNNNPPYPYDYTSSVVDEIPQDVINYMEDITQGRFYEKIQEVSNCSREIAKEKTIKDFFFGKSYQLNNSIPKAIRQLYPTVYSLVEGLKKEKGYEYLSHQLQRAESNFIIHVVCKELMDHYPDNPVLTVHDSILATPDHIPIVRDVINQQAIKHLGMTPTLKLKGNV